VPEENIQEEVQPVDPQTDYAAEKIELVRNINQLTELYNASQCDISNLQTQLKDANATIEHYKQQETEIKNMIMSDGLAYPVDAAIMPIIKNLVKQRDTLSNIEYALARIAISGDTALDKISNLEQTCIKHVQNNVECANALLRVGFTTNTSIMDNNVLEGIEWLKTRYRNVCEAGNELGNDPHEIEVKGLKEELSHKQRTIEAFIALVDKL
jgi:hypothetical protein